MAVTIRLRRDTAANWTSADPVLALAEVGVETDTGKIKIGDGSTAWSGLSYFSGVSVALDDATDVTIDGTPADDEVLAYDSGAGEWQNQTAAEAGVATASDLTAHEGDTSNPHSVTAAQADALPEDAAILSKSGAYELAAGDEGKTVECDGTFTLNLPDGLDKGFQVAVVNVGTGTITLAADTTLQSAGGLTTLATQYEMAVVYHRGSNVWLAGGGLE